MENTKRITKANRYDDIVAFVKGEPVQYGTTVDDIVAFCEHEKGLLAKKNTTGGEKKQTAKQAENEIVKSHIVDYLMTLPMDCDGITCTEIGKGIPELANKQNQYISQLMRQLKEDGRVIKTIVKGKALFKAA